ncbi:hypothetical protein [Acinetobacter baumannii]|uniref:Uncharacterized protein n=1 Tax=Acinetobacter baumannii TaxID=470 RepID=A0A335FPX7_ACIBA|nr:hypothetical protein [Acinetobacter baumannii]SST19937.1 Uncharacterised protein [Acinetobacter baumannii]
MKPEQFIREFGVDKAREVVEGAPEGATHYGLRQYRQWEGRILKTFTDESWRSTAVFGGNLRFIEDDCLKVQDLKRLVQSVEIVELFESIEGAKDAYKNGLGFHSVLIGGYEIPIVRLGDAIKDHESIYGGGDE